MCWFVEYELDGLQEEKEEKMANVRISSLKLSNEINKVINLNINQLIEIYFIPSSNSSNSNSNSSVNLNNFLLFEILLNDLNNIYNNLLSSSPSSSSFSPSSNSSSNSSSSSSNQNQNNLLSISHLRSIYTSIEIIWTWGILPYLKINNYQINNDNIPKSIEISKGLLIDGYNYIQSLQGNGIHSFISFIDIMFKICTFHMFRGMMLERNLKRMLCAIISILCQHRVGPQPLSEKGYTFLFRIFFSFLKLYYF